MVRRNRRRSSQRRLRIATSYTRRSSCYDFWFFIYRHFHLWSKSLQSLEIFFFISWNTTYLAGRQSACSLDTSCRRCETRRRIWPRSTTENLFSNGFNHFLAHFFLVLELTELGKVWRNGLRTWAVFGYLSQTLFRVEGTSIAAQFLLQLSVFSMVLSMSLSAQID